jgi:hypothetical protein
MRDLRVFSEGHDSSSGKHAVYLCPEGASPLKTGQWKISTGNGALDAISAMGP